MPTVSRRSLLKSAVGLVAAGTVLNGRDYLFGGGDQTGVARGQRPWRAVSRPG